MVRARQVLAAASAATTSTGPTEPDSNNHPDADQLPTAMPDLDYPAGCCASENLNGIVKEYLYADSSRERSGLAGRARG